MRILNLILAVVAVGGVAFLFVRGNDQAEVRDSLASLESRVEELGADVERLTAAQSAADSKSPVDETSRKGVADLRRRTVALERVVQGMRDQLAEAAAERQAREAQLAAAQEAAREAAEAARREAELAKAAQEAAAEKAKAAEPDRSAEVADWIKLLSSANGDDVFKATVELARLKDKRATESLVGILKTHRDFYSRLGAATALGELSAAEAVPALIDALDDKDELVRTASAEALHKLTRKDMGYRSGLPQKARREIQERCREWWADNEDEVVSRLEDGR